jgi:hypothetical protein
MSNVHICIENTSLNRIGEYTIECKNEIWKLYSDNGGDNVEINSCPFCGLQLSGNQITNPMTAREQEILEHLVQAWNKFSGLQQSHPMDLTEFTSAINVCQQKIGMRVLRRQYPHIWPDRTESCKSKEENK